MTQLRKQRDAISNYFDHIEAGIGKRGSTFTDVDAVSHDKDTHRFLFREFKQKGEPLDKVQRWVLTELADLPRCTVWFLRRLGNNRIGFAEFKSGKRVASITTEEYQERLRCWWNNVPFVINSDGATIQRAEQEPCPTSKTVKASEINWGIQ